SLCDRLDLVVTKTAAPELERTYDYVVTKTATDDEQSANDPDGSTFEYTVSVSRGGYTDGGWRVTGTISIANGNDITIEDVDVSDAIAPGATCLVEGQAVATVDVPPAGASLDYECTYSQQPATLSQTNTATASWDDFGSPTTSDTGTAPVDWSAALLDETDETAVLIDSEVGALNNGDPIAYADLEVPFTETYELDWVGVPGSCKDFDNTATVYGGDTDDSLSQDTETVTLCDYVDLVVTKTASPALSRTWTWGIDKSVDKTSVTTSASTATFNYTVKVTRSAPSDSGWTVTGTISIANGNDITIEDVDVSDAIGAGATCLVEGQPVATVDVPPTGATLDYECTYSQGPASSSQTNTATATWDAFGSPNTSDTGTASIDWTKATVTKVDDQVTVTDTQRPGWSQVVKATDATPTTITYSKTFPVVTGCASYDNTAGFVTNTTGTTGSDTVTVRVCKSITGGYTMGYWQNKNGLKDIAKMGVAGCTALKTAYPNVLSGLNCSSTTTFQSSVTAIIKAAEASGDGDPMFKGQFLATALSVRKTSALGSTSISVSTAVFPSACMTVNQLLAYGNANYAALKLDKTVFMAVKSVYDDINNNRAITC
ncbi:MAG: hypothetical protein LCI03_18165, partial [Actinobacteria bacterium]|nr:hypothetical protein [Actinomycetota bacterium]